KTKISGNGIIFCLALSSVLYFIGCVKSNIPNTTTTSNSIKTIIANSTNATLLDTAFTRAGLDSVYTYGGPFTFFVATDGAFIMAGITDSVFDNLPDSQLKKIILYNTLPLNSLPGQLPTGTNVSVQTISGDSVFITNNNSNGSDMFINGIQIESTGLIASNGVIDAVAKLVLPPAGTILQVAQADTSFSYFAAAVARTSAGQTDIGSILSNGNVYTLFLPDNNAFRGAGYATTADVSAANPDSLATILLYHILPKRVFTSDFQSAQTQQTLLTNKTVTYGLLGGSAYAVSGFGNSGPSIVLFSNIMAHNGVIQVIGQLLIP
ncbi:MAG TPA: fasciclin domain-containing protein, partial [Puia sp.]|nr:fasciclin domain-containing protein [Puia sp.]